MSHTATNAQQLRKLTATLMDLLVNERLENFYGHISITVHLEDGVIQGFETTRTKTSKRRRSTLPKKPRPGANR